MIINVKVNGFEILYTPTNNLYISNEDFAVSCNLYFEDGYVLYDNLKTELHNIEKENELKNVVYRIQDNLLLFADTEEFNVVFEIIRDLREFNKFLED